MNHKGETIISVLTSVVIIGLVVAMAFILIGRSQRLRLVSTEREIVLNALQNQLEGLKFAIINNELINDQGTADPSDDVHARDIYFAFADDDGSGTYYKGSSSVVDVNLFCVDIYEGSVTGDKFNKIPFTTSSTDGRDIADIRDNPIAATDFNKRIWGLARETFTGTMLTSWPDTDKYATNDYIEAIDTHSYDSNGDPVQNNCYRDGRNPLPEDAKLTIWVEYYKWGTESTSTPVCATCTAEEGSIKGDGQDVFVFKATWESIDGSGQQEFTRLIYRIHPLPDL